MYQLTKHFWMSCAHSVPNAGKCERIHGHNYKVTFCILGKDLDDNGMLIDFREIKHHLEKKYDHHFLNDFNEFKEIPPTTERVSRVFFEIVKSLCEQKENKPQISWLEVEETNEAKVLFKEDKNGEQ